GEKTGPGRGVLCRGGFPEPLEPVRDALGFLMEGDHGVGRDIARRLVVPAFRHIAPVTSQGADVRRRYARQRTKSAAGYGPWGVPRGRSAPSAGEVSPSRPL